MKLSDGIAATTPAQRQRGTAPDEVTAGVAVLALIDPPVIELIYRGPQLMAILVKGDIPTEQLFMLMGMLGRKIRVANPLATKWGLKHVICDPKWQYPPTKPDGQRMAFI